MIAKSIQDIVPADIDALVANAVEEGNQLDFKGALVGGTREDKKEFVADVCASPIPEAVTLYLAFKKTRKDERRPLSVPT